VGGRERLLAVGIPLACAALGALSVWLFGRSKRIALTLCCAIVALDGLVSFGAFFEWRHSPSPGEAASLYSAAAPPAWGAVAGADGGFTRYLAVATWALPTRSWPEVTDLKGLRSANGYGPLTPRRYSTVVGGMLDSGLLEHPEQFTRHRSWLLDVLRVSTVLVQPRLAPRATPPWFDSRSEAGGLVRYTYRPRLPAAYLVGDARIVDARTAVAAGRGKIPFDPTRSALVEGRCGLCASMTAQGITGIAARWAADSVSASIDAPRPSLLVVSQSWTSGWSATVDGRAAPVVRADALVLGVPVPAGRHHVRLEYHTPGLKTGGLISGSAVLGFVLVPALLRLRRAARRRSPRRRD
jgi:hypothetical protein